MRAPNDDGRKAAPNPTPADILRHDNGPPPDAHGRVDSPLNRIGKERIPILAATGKSDSAALSAYDRKLLENVRFRYLIVKRLNAIVAHQAKEITRLLTAIEAHRPDLEAASDLTPFATRR